MSKGYVYLVKASTGHYKIGMTQDVRKRFKVFSVEMPIHVYLAHVFSADDMRQAEATLHSLYAEQRVAGEWFSLSQDQIDYIFGITAYLGGSFHRVPPDEQQRDVDRFLAAYERVKLRAHCYDLIAVDPHGQKEAVGRYQDLNEVSLEWYRILELVNTNVDSASASKRFEETLERMVQRGHVNKTMLIGLAGEE